MPLCVGQPAPAFRRADHDGKEIVVGPEQEQVTVVYFYPKDETPGCTVEACGFRDHYAELEEAGAIVVGVSPDSDASHRAFAANHRLPFSLLEDADGELRRRFDVGKTLGLLPGRVSFVIDEAGIIRHVFNSQLRARKHVAEAVRIVRDLAKR